MCRALFAAGQLVSRLSSSFKGGALVDGVLEALRYIMQGVELAANNPRQAALHWLAPAAAAAVAVAIAAGNFTTHCHCLINSCGLACRM
jgi:uncharacterized membrane protein